MIAKKEVYEWYHSVKKKKVQSVDLEVVERLKQELKNKLKLIEPALAYPEIFDKVIDDVFSMEKEYLTKNAFRKWGDEK